MSVIRQKYNIPEDWGFEQIMGSCLQGSSYSSRARELDMPTGSFLSLVSTYPEYKVWKSHRDQTIYISGKPFLITDLSDYRSLLHFIWDKGFDFYDCAKELGVEWSSLKFNLEKYSPDFSRWFHEDYPNIRNQNRLLKNFGLSLTQLKDWRSLLGPNVLSCKQSIASRSLELFPNHSDSTLQNILRYAPDSYHKWLETYSSPKTTKVHAEEYFREYFQKQGFDVCSYNRLPLNGSKAQIDLFFPALNKGFELNGYVYHCNPSPIEGYSNRSPTYHRDKTTSASNLGIKLYHLWYNDYREKDRLDLITSMIEAKLGIFQHKYYARKLSIESISDSEAFKFYNMNHNQGRPAGHQFLNLALKNEDQVISCMSFYHRYHQLELSRFANLRHSCVVGGFSRLFKHALDILPKEDIVSYGDRDLIPDPLDSVYLRNSFSLVESDPNRIPLQLCYFLPKKVLEYPSGIYSRYTFQKYKLLRLFPEESPLQREIDIAIKHGIFPCYNSGCWKFIYYR